MDIVELVIIPLLSGIAASMGLGGGTFLIVWLTAFSGMAQVRAQGINLIFFIPIAAASVFIYGRQGLIDKKILLPAIVGGAISAFVFSTFASKISSELISKMFGAFILVFGMKTLAEDKSDK